MLRGSDPTAVLPFVDSRASEPRALMQHLGLARSHIVGHSTGALVALQLALDAPAHVHSLALLEPALFLRVPSTPQLLEGIAPVMRLFETGDRAKAGDLFMQAFVGPDYRSVIDRSLPSTTFSQFMRDFETMIRVEFPALQSWKFTQDDARRIKQPVLLVVGADTLPIFRETHQLAKEWLPHAAELVLPKANHWLMAMNPEGMATGLAAFFVRHSFQS